MRLRRWGWWHILWAAPLASILFNILWERGASLLGGNACRGLLGRSIEVVLIAFMTAFPILKFAMANRLAGRLERENLDRVASGLGAGLYLVDRDFHIQWVNRAIEKRFGPLKHLKGRTCHDAFWNEPEICPNCPRRTSRDGAEAVPFDKIVVDRRGLRRYYELINFPIMDAAGRTNQFLELVQDTSRVMTLLSKLKAHESEMGELFEDSTDAIFVCDLETGHILLTNPAFQRWVGYTRLQLLTNNWSDVYAPSSSEGRPALLSEIAQEGSTNEIDLPFTRSDGRRIVLNCTAAVTTYQGRQAVIISGRPGRGRDDGD